MQIEPSPADLSGVGNERLTITIQNQRPVELIDLTKSLFGVADEYRRYTQRNPEINAGEDLRLYVRELRAGSLIADLMPYAPLALPLLNDVNTISQFCGFLSSTYDYFIGRGVQTSMPVPLPILDKPDLQNLHDIVNVVAKDSGSNIVFEGNTFNGPVFMRISSMEANAAQNNIDRAVKAIKEPAYGTKEKVALHLYQTRNSLDSNVGDRGIIESISPNHIKIDFLDNSIKGEMLMDDPYKYYFIVDVAVETVNNKPILYKILRLHDKDIK